jgi:tellurite resistance protein
VETVPAHRLRFFPVTWFATVMGLAGFALAWRQASVLMPVHPLVPTTLSAFAAAMFVLLLGFYAAKLFKHRDDVIKEWHHPVRVNFVPTLSIGLILLATTFASDATTLSYWLWSAGSLLNLALTLYVMTFWINHTGFQIQHMNPAWFIPVVGNILVPVVGVQHASAEISWFFFSVGLVFWLVLFTIVLYRVIFHDPLPERLVPTLFILIAPPAVGFLAYVAINGTVDSFARVLYYTAFFLTLLLFTQLRRFARLQFFLSWWAYSFPVAAITIATLRMYRDNGHPVLHWASWLLLVVLTALIVMLVVRTARAVQRGEICVEEK